MNLHKTLNVITKGKNRKIEVTVKTKQADLLYVSSCTRDIDYITAKFGAIGLFCVPVSSEVYFHRKVLEFNVNAIVIDAGSVNPTENFKNAILFAKLRNPGVLIFMAITSIYSWRDLKNQWQGYADILIHHPLNFDDLSILSRYLKNNFIQISQPQH